MVRDGMSGLLHLSFEDVRDERYAATASCPSLRLCLEVSEVVAAVFDTLHYLALGNVLCTEITVRHTPGYEKELRT